VTFAFTDIEGSTVRWERDRNAMEVALRRHDAIMRAAIVQHDGYVFKTIGDAFCAAFSRPENGVAAMLAAQRGLAAEDFSAVDGVRVRAALHTGATDERDGDYFGPAVNRVARLLAVGHGGQVLLSGVVSDLVQGSLPAECSLRDLGEHRLKDLARPEQVYQLLAHDLETQFPPLRSLAALPNNLPLQRTSLIGRETEVAEIAALIGKSALVTLVGSGGIGKTRISLQVGANLLDGSGDGVWFIELAPLASGDYIPTAIASAMNITLDRDADPLRALTSALKAKHALLIFDNCEHLVEPTARVVAAILASCPRVRVLASTRQALGISGESTYRVPTLTIPQALDELRAVDAATFPAVALFVERAGAVDQRFALTDENALVIADICRRLDGIPLAIELAAARVKILSPRQLRDRLDERFRVLTGGSRDLLPRQQTLRALIDWSHDLLDERERMLLRRLGVFVSGFAMEGAVAVGRGAERLESIDEFDVFDLLASLVDKSLILAEPAGDSLRYRMLESTRAYAREKLAAAGELCVTLDLHCRYLIDLFAPVRAHWNRTNRIAEINALFQAELEEVRAALDRAVDGGDPKLGAALLALTGGWKGFGLTREGVARVERFLTTIPPDDPRLAGQLTLQIVHLIGESAKGAQAAASAVRLGREANDPALLAEALALNVACLARVNRVADAREALAEAAHLIPPDNTRLRTLALQSRAIVSGLTGDYAGAAEAFRALRNAALVDQGVAAACIYAANLAESEHALGNTAAAVTIISDQLPALRAANNRRKLKELLGNLCGYLVALDRLAEVRATTRELAQVVGEDTRDASFTMALEHAALAIALDNDISRAAILAGYTETTIAQIGMPREYSEKMTRTRLEAILAERLTPNELAAFQAKGALLAPDDAIALTLADKLG
jgi:predicted ATPase/class 3 adenylate cyclase